MPTVAASTLFATSATADGGIQAADITDSSAAGRALLTALNVEAQRTALGLSWEGEPITSSNTPPTSPSVGDTYFVTATATGDWAGQERKKAIWDGVDWQFFDLREGEHAFIDGAPKRWTATPSPGAWLADPPGNVNDRVKIVDLASTTDVAMGTALVGYKRAGTPATAGRTLLAKMKDVANILDWIPVAQHSAIADRTTSDDHTTAIQAAQLTGEMIYYPVGRFRTTAGIVTGTVPLLMTGAGVSSAVSGTEIVVEGGPHDGFTAGVIGTTTTGHMVKNIKFLGDLTRTGAGNIIKLNQATTSVLEDLVFYSRGNAVHAERGANITFNRCTFGGIKSAAASIPTTAIGSGFYALKLSGDDAISLNVVNIWGCQFSPDSTTAANRGTGIWIDGAVDTVSIVSSANTRMGRGLVVQNTNNYANGPDYISAFDFQSDFSEQEGIYMDAIPATGHYFYAAYVHGSQLARNIVLTDNVTNVQFHGGACTGAYEDGIFIDGSECRLYGMTVARNGLKTTNTYDGVVFGPNANNCHIVGGNIGRRNTLTGIQRYGVRVSAGAVDVTCTADLTGNETDQYLDEGSTTSTGGEFMAERNAGGGFRAFYSGNALHFRIGSGAPTTVSNFRATGAPSGGSPALQIESTDANAGAIIATKGTGIGRLRWDASDAFTWDQTRLDARLPLRLPNYTVATLPSAATHGRSLIYVADGSSSRRIAYSDGGNWRFMDGAIVS